MTTEITMTITEANAATLLAEIAWLDQIMLSRYHSHFATEPNWVPFEQFEPPIITLATAGSYGRLVLEESLSPRERLVLILALVSHVRPDQLDPLFTLNTAINKPVSAFGGHPAINSVPFLPTIETALWFLAPLDLPMRFECQHMFSAEHVFHRKRIIILADPGGLHTEFGKLLSMPSNWVHLLTSGTVLKAQYSPDFPADSLTTQMEEEDIVLSRLTWESIREVQSWLRHRERLHGLPNLGKRIRPGLRILFHGPPGTGKSLLAAWLGRQAKMEVYRIDLSMVVSKWIGETEKNLGKVFDKAGDENWILFFDEADALFGKRTDVSSSHDRYANQEVAYLLQRVETFPGLVILATNLKDNIDAAFSRRFDVMVHFPKPGPQEREQLWRTAFEPVISPGPDFDYSDFAKKYDLSGGQIVNIVRYATLAALDLDASNEQIVVPEDVILKGIHLELGKESIYLRY
jgi:ATPase family associated with various cellular activities (AAA)